MCHSSGAHVVLWWMVERAIQQQPLLQSSLSSSSSLLFDSLVGLSGVYNISYHFQYEAVRGVEEMSPMKPVCGFTESSFLENSPALRLRAALASHAHRMCLPPRILLVHGMEDATVPFTTTADAARVLRSCGVTQTQELYLAKTGHLDVVLQLMLGGKAQRAVMDWLLLSSSSSSSSFGSSSDSSDGGGSSSGSNVNDNDKSRNKTYNHNISKSKL